MWKRIDWTECSMAVIGGATALLAHTGLLLFVMRATLAPFAA